MNHVTGRVIATVAFELILVLGISLTILGLRYLMKKADALSLLCVNSIT